MIRGLFTNEEEQEMESMMKTREWSEQHDVSQLNKQTIYLHLVMKNLAGPLRSQSQTSHPHLDQERRGTVGGEHDEEQVEE